LSLQLDVHLDRQPVTGRLRTAHGADVRFVGWFGFVEALAVGHCTRTTRAVAYLPPSRGAADRSGGAIRQLVAQLRLQNDGYASTMWISSTAAASRR
jgi:hypothetical protein